MPLKLALAVRGTVAGHSLGALGAPLPMHPSGARGAGREGTTTQWLQPEIRLTPPPRAFRVTLFCPNRLCPPSTARQPRVRLPDLGAPPLLQPPRAKAPSSPPLPPPLVKRIPPSTSAADTNTTPAQSPGTDSTATGGGGPRKSLVPMETFGHAPHQRRNARANRKNVRCLSPAPQRRPYGGAAAGPSALG